MATPHLSFELLSFLWGPDSYSPSFLGRAIASAFPILSPLKNNFKWKNKVFHMKGIIYP